VQHHSQDIKADTLKTQNIPATLPVYITIPFLQPSSVPQILTVTKLVSISVIVSFRECSVNGIMRSVTFLPLTFFIQHSSDSFRLLQVRVPDSLLWCGFPSCGHTTAHITVHLVKDTWVVSKSLLFCGFPLHGHITAHTTIHLVKDIWVVSRFSPYE